MRALRRFLIRLVRSVTRRRDEERLREEVEAHLALQTEANVRAGMSPDEAGRQARLKFGAVEAVKEDYRDEQGLPFLDRLGQDVRYTLRQLRRAPSFTLTVTLTLALGIGATTAIFSLFYQVLLRPLPVPDADRLVSLAPTGPQPGSKRCGTPGGCDEVFSYPMFRGLERVQSVFTGIAAHHPFNAHLSYRGQTSSGEGLLVSGSYFPVVGLPPALGRLLERGDDRTINESPVVVLSYAYWQSRIGGRPDILNDTMIVNGRPLTIVGVAPRGFDGTTVGLKPQVFVPITMRWPMEPDEKQDHDNRRSSWLFLFARLKPDVSIEQARAAVNVPYHAIINNIEAPLQIQAGISDQTLARFKAKELRVEPGRQGQSEVLTDARVPLTLLLGVTTLVLLIAWVNIANLLLARAARRASEMAMRISLGAGRGRLIAQLLTESSLLALCGGIASLFVARGTMSLVRSLVAVDVVGRNLPLHLDASALFVTATLALGTSLLVGLIPALYATRPDVLSPLKGQAGQPAGGRGAARCRASLATAQAALSMVLLVLAGLFTKSLVNVTRVDLGLNVDNLVTFSIEPINSGYTLQRSAAFFDRIERELTALPGVTAAASSWIPALSGSNWWDSVLVEGAKDDQDVAFDAIGPGYFRVLGVPLMAGREFTPADALDTPKVAIVNEALAKTFDLGRDIVGRRMGSDELELAIVGLVRDAKHSSPKEVVPPRFYLPHRQNDTVGHMSFYVRTSVRPEHVMASIRGVVSRVDPNLPIENLRTMRQQMRDETLMVERFLGILTTAFAGLATLLAAIGLYGVLAYTVAQRTREIGLRMALGAAPGRVRGMVLRQVAMMAAIGGVIGLAAAVALGRAAEALLFEMQGHDPIVLTAAGVTLALVALGAGFIPAHRASRVDPMRALRYE